MSVPTPAPGEPSGPQAPDTTSDDGRDTNWDVLLSAADDGEAEGEPEGRPAPATSGPPADQEETPTSGGPPTPTEPARPEETPEGERPPDWERTAWALRGNLMQAQRRQQEAVARAQQLERDLAERERVEDERYQRAIQQAQTPEDRSALQQALQQRLFDRQQAEQQQLTERERGMLQQERARLAQYAQAQEQARHHYFATQVRQVADSALGGFFTEYSKELGLDTNDEEVQEIRAELVDHEDLRRQFANTPPELLPAVLHTAGTTLERRLRGAVDRIARRNRDGARRDGTYRREGAGGSAGGRAAPQTIDDAKAALLREFGR